MQGHDHLPIQGLSDEQVVGLYTGRIRNWNQIGGQNAPIVVVNKAEGRSTLELFLHYYRLKGADVRADVVIGDNEQGIKTVAGNPNAIGYVSVGTAEYDASHGTPIKLLPMAGVTPSVEAILSGRFPLTRPLNLVMKAAPHGLAQAFIEFARSSAVHDLIKEQNFVPIAD